MEARPQIEGRRLDEFLAHLLQIRVESKGGIGDPVEDPRCQSEHMLMERQDTRDGKVSQIVQDRANNAGIRNSSHEGH